MYLISLFYPILDLTLDDYNLIYSYYATEFRIFFLLITELEKSECDADSISEFNSFSILIGSISISISDSVPQSILIISLSSGFVCKFYVFAPLLSHISKSFSSKFPLPYSGIANIKCMVFFNILFISGLSLNVHK